MEILKDLSACMIYVSTDFVFDGKKEVSYKEDDNTNPLGVYGKTKLEGEKVVRELLSRYAIVRTSWLYGEGGKNFVNTILKKGKNEKILQVIEDQVGSPTYTKDLAYAVEKLAGMKDIFKCETFHISNSGQCSWYGFAEEILKNNNDVKIESIPSERLDRPATRPKFSVLDISKFEKATNYKMRSWQEALREYLEGNQ